MPNSLHVSIPFRMSNDPSTCTEIKTLADAIALEDELTTHDGSGTLTSSQFALEMIEGIESRSFRKS